MSKKVALVGDGSDHGGSLISSGQDGSLKVGGVAAAVEGAQHSCPVKGHGVTSVIAVTTKSYHNGKLILTEEATAGCGAKLSPVDRSVYIE